MSSETIYTCHDRTPFTYLVGWSKLDKWYYGRRTAKGCSPLDLWKTYFTSSKKVRDLRKQYGEPDIIQVRKIFSNIKQCQHWENKVQVRMKVVESVKWLNQVTANPKFDTTGTKDSDEVRAKKSMSRRKFLDNQPESYFIAHGVKIKERKAKDPISVSNAAKKRHETILLMGKKEEINAKQKVSNSLAYHSLTPEQKEARIQKQKETIRRKKEGHSLL